MPDYIHVQRENLKLEIRIVGLGTDREGTINVQMIHLIRSMGKGSSIGKARDLNDEGGK